MSWKGLQKAMSRLPHSVLNKKGQATRDIEFEELESRFQATASVINQLKSDIQTYHDNITAYIYNQRELGLCLAKLYSKDVGIREEKDPQSTTTTRTIIEEDEQDPLQDTEGVSNQNQSGSTHALDKFDANIPSPAKEEEEETPALQAARDMEAAMALCRDDILCELSASIQNEIIRPITELQTIIKQIQKTIVKRNHKLVDYDRYRHQLNKLLLSYKPPNELQSQQKQQPQAKHDIYKQQRQQQKEQQQHSHDEKAIFKLQAQLETATIEYDTLNQSLKDQLPIFFDFFREQFLRPSFERLYNFQRTFYHTLYTYCDDLSMANIDYFSDFTQQNTALKVAKDLTNLKLFHLNGDMSSSSRKSDVTTSASGRSYSGSLGIKNRLSAQLKNRRSSRADMQEPTLLFDVESKLSSQETSDSVASSSSTNNQKRHLETTVSRSKHLHERPGSPKQSSSISIVEIL